MLEAAGKLNGTIWVFTAILIGLVLVQSFLFLRLALKFNKKNKLVTKEEVKRAVQTGAISAIGPSFSSLVVAISLITVVGSATTYMRCGVIGAPVWELMMANLAASTVGITLGSSGITENMGVAAVVCYLVNRIAKKVNSGFLGSCNMAIAMICGMAVAQCVNLMIG